VADFFMFAARLMFGERLGRLRRPRTETKPATAPTTLT
jgi:hypothetical protein